MDEFASLLEYFTVQPGSMIIVGDFNFYVDNPSDVTARSFLSLLEAFNLCQQINQAAHRAGHILDLVLTRNDDKNIKS